MEPASTLAPPVVAVMVVHEPGAWFDDVLAGLARQDYSNLKTLVLVDGGGATGEVASRVAALVPRAFVRAVDHRHGFGRVANEVLRLVEGDNGFFCFLHDDVALEPDAIRLLVEEMYRSNAGIVGPKLVDWDDPTVLQHVGYAVDRFGEIDPLVEPGETDQEQHDAVRDVFALPSACLLVRADLFHSLGGFDPDISFHGEDLDLCWRAHHQGARVLVVPSARARHLEALEARRPDLAHEVLRARHRMRSVATLSGARRLPLLMLQLVLVTLAQFVVGMFTGHAARAVAGVRALIGLVPRLPRIIARRRAIAGRRLVPDREVVGLQLRGSARMAAHLRSRDARPDVQRGSGKAWRERAGAGAAIGWLVVVVIVVAGSRELLAGGVPPIGQFLPFGDSPRALLDQYSSGWNPEGLGRSGASPTGLALVAIGSVATLFRMGLLHTLGIVGLLLAGALGMWRLSAGFSTTRARLASTIVYVAVPLPGQLVSMGRWGALLCFAALPWSIDALRRYAGLGPGPRDEEGERTTSFGPRRHVQLLAGGTLVAAIATAFEPTYPFVLLLVTILLTAATLLTGAPLVAPLRIAIGGAAASLGALLLNLPWMLELIGDGGWTAVVGPAPAGDRGYSVFDLATFNIGNATAVVLAVALYVPVLAAVLLGRGWRLGWAARGGFLVVGFGWMAVLDDSGSFVIRTPEPGIMLVPVAVGIAIAAGCVLASFELDVRGGSFGWRQPLALVALVTVAIGMVPALFAVGTGRYDTPETTLVDLLGQLPDESPDGEYRVLWVGRADVVPAAAHAYRPGIGYAVTDGPDLDVADAFAAVPGPGAPEVMRALDAIATGTTTRGGRLLAPLGVRYLAVPLIDGAVSTNDDALPPPDGLIDALGDQLDLAEVYSPPNFILFENRAWVPVRSVLTVEGADSSLDAGPAALAQADLAGATPIMPGADHLAGASADVPAGTVHLGVPLDRGWRLEGADGTEVDSRPAFGTTMAFDVDAPGTVTLDYRTSQGFRLLLVAQLLLWAGVVIATSSVRIRRPRRNVRPAMGMIDEPMITLDPIIVATAGAAIAGAAIAGAGSSGAGSGAAPHDDSTGALAAVFGTTASNAPDVPDADVPDVDAPDADIPADSDGTVPS